MGSLHFITVLCTWISISVYVTGQPTLATNFADCPFLNEKQCFACAPTATMQSCLDNGYSVRCSNGRKCKTITTRTTTNAIIGVEKACVERDDCSSLPTNPFCQDNPVQQVCTTCSDAVCKPVGRTNGSCIPPDYLECFICNGENEAECKQTGHFEICNGAKPICKLEFNTTVNLPRKTVAYRRTCSDLDNCPECGVDVEVCRAMPNTNIRNCSMCHYDKCSSDPTTVRPTTIEDTTVITTTTTEATTAVPPDIVILETTQFETTTEPFTTETTSTTTVKTTTLLEITTTPLETTTETILDTTTVAETTTQPVTTSKPEPTTQIFTTPSPTTEITTFPATTTTENATVEPPGQLMITECGPGNYTFCGTCYLCPNGTYQPDANQAKCITCCEGSTTLAEGSDSVEDCICKPGYYKKRVSNKNGDKDTCLPCKKGYFQPEYDQDFCYQCPSGYTTKLTARNHSSYCQPCYPGYYMDTKTMHCKQCPLDHYQPSYGSIKCIPCAADKKTNQIGSFNKDQCIPVCQCSVNATCTRLGRTGQCTCKKYYYENGATCIHECNRGYCLNGCKCRKKNNDEPYCEVLAGYTGMRCEQKKTEKSKHWWILGVVLGLLFLLGIIFLVMYLICCRPRKKQCRPRRMVINKCVKPAPCVVRKPCEPCVVPKPRVVPQPCIVPKPCVNPQPQIKRTIFYPKPAPRKEVRYRIFTQPYNVDRRPNCESVKTIIRSPADYTYSTGACEQPIAQRNYCKVSDPVKKYYRLISTPTQIPIQTEIRQPGRSCYYT